VSDALDLEPTASPPRGEAQASLPARAKLERRARLRGQGAVLVLLAATIIAVVSDLARRGTRLRALEPVYLLTYGTAVVESAIVWGVLLYAASRRRGFTRWLNAALFVIALTFSLGGQAYFFQQYNAYLNTDVSVFASNFRDSVINQLSADIGNYVSAKLPPFLLALSLVWVGRNVLRPRHRRVRLAGVIGPILLVASFFVPTQHRHAQASTPDILYLNAVGGLIRTQLGLTEQSDQVRPRQRESLPVPPLTRANVPARNVLFVILESVRADSVCVEHDPECRRTEATNRLLPGRYPLTQMRSMASCTAISLAVLWSGLLPTESRDTLHTWPLIFDYARAAGYDTAFWTSQNMMFGNARLWVKNLGVTQFISATELEPTSDLDMGAPEALLATHVSRGLGELKEPFLAVVQLSNVHYPYFVDPSLPMPFQPSSTSKSPEDNTAFRNLYQNSVHQQDIHVAQMLANLRNSEAGSRTVVVYTSDHAEAFREHGQMGHTFSIFDEEIKVPAWVDAPAGTLTDEERRNLESKRDEYVFHVDLAPTVLDLIGVKDDPGIAEYRLRMPGTSLLAPGTTDIALPLSNCAGVWSCAFENWGYMRKNLKLEARSWDPGWKCYDLATDPDERVNLGPEGCGDLASLAQTTFGRLPGAPLQP
jgi:glucan phosphoethanolaminetransferase (alkaline phosphatase superfamily)